MTHPQTPAQAVPDSKPFPHAVLPLGGKLSATGRLQIAALSGHRPARFCAELVFTWAMVAAIVALGIYADNLAVTFFCGFLIATRQIVLGLLMHEQVHRLGWRSKYADWMVNLFAVYPLFVTSVEAYAKVHLSHHKYFLSKDDPDFLRKSGEEWTFPKSVRHFFLILLKDLTALNVVKLVRGKSGFAIDEFTRRNPTPKWVRLCFYAVVAVLLTVFGGWKLFLIYWVLPLITICQVMIRWIAISEHKYNIENGSVHETTPLLELSWWQRLLTPDLNFGLHVYHHLHPGVSFANLPKVHKIYQSEGLVDESAVFHGQWDYLKFLLSAK